MPLATFYKACNRSVSGNMHLILADVASVYSVTVSGGEVTDIALNAGSYFYEIQADPNTLRRDTNGVGSKDKIYYEHLVTWQCSKPNADLNELSDNLSDSSVCGIIAIVVDSTGAGWLIGYNETDGLNRPLYLRGDDFDSGSEAADGNKRTYTLRGLSGSVDLPISTTMATYIMQSIAAGTDLGFTP